MKKIPLTQGQFALVDDKDYLGLSKFKWCANKDKNTFYVRRKKEGRVIRMHREILSAPPSMHVDHIDGNGLNNQRNNIRLCTSQENARNRRVGHKSISEYKGVAWSHASRKWAAHIKVHGKQVHLGYFFCLMKAVKAYSVAAKKYYGEFANTEPK